MSQRFHGGQGRSDASLRPALRVLACTRYPRLLLQCFLVCYSTLANAIEHRAACHTSALLTFVGLSEGHASEQNQRVLRNLRVEASAHEYLGRVKGEHSVTASPPLLWDVSGPHVSGV